MSWWDERVPLRGAEAARRAFVRDAAAKRRVRVFPAVLSLQESAAVAAAASLAARQQGGWLVGRHGAYPSRDLPAGCLPPALRDALQAQLTERLVAPLAASCGFATEHLAVRDLFVAVYSVGGQAGLQLHRDGSLLSFNILLTPAEDFCGGGTQFPHLEGDKLASAGLDRWLRGTVVQLGQGDAVAHSGGVLHAGNNVTAGERMVLVGFVDSVRAQHSTDLSRDHRS
jgi:hypothetical protein